MQEYCNGTCLTMHLFYVQVTFDVECTFQANLFYIQVSGIPQKQKRSSLNKLSSENIEKRSGWLSV